MVELTGIEPVSTVLEAVGLTMRKSHFTFGTPHITPHFLQTPDKALNNCCYFSDTINRARMAV